MKFKTLGHCESVPFSLNSALKKEVFLCANKKKNITKTTKGIKTFIGADETITSHYH